MSARADASLPGRSRILVLILAGFGYGMLNPTSTKAVIAWFPLRQRATMVGLKQVGLPFGVLSDRVFGGRRRAPLLLAGVSSALCSLAMAWTGPGSHAAWLTVLALVFGFVGIGWNGVQHTLMAELAGPRAAGTTLGFGLAISSAGVTLAPPIFGWVLELAGGYRPAWIAPRAHDGRGARAARRRPRATANIRLDQALYRNRHIDSA